MVQRKKRGTARVNRKVHGEEVVNMIETKKSTARTNRKINGQNDFDSVVKRHPCKNRGNRDRLEYDTSYVAVITGDDEQKDARKLTFMIFVNKEQGVEHNESYPMTGNRSFLLDNLLGTFGVDADVSLEGEICMVHFSHNTKNGHRYKNFCVDESISREDAEEHFRESFGEEGNCNDFDDEDDDLEDEDNDLEDDLFDD